MSEAVDVEMQVRGRIGMEVTSLVPGETEVNAKTHENPSPSAPL